MREREKFRATRNIVKLNDTMIDDDILFGLDAAHQVIDAVNLGRECMELHLL